MPFLGVTHKVMHDTTRVVLDGLVEDVVDSNTEQEMSEAASKLKEANRSYGIRKYNFSSDSDRLELFSDLDCMAIHAACQRLEQQPHSSPWVHLADYLVEVGNMVAYPRSSPFAFIAFKVVCTDQNDRTRSSLSSRKPLDMASAKHPATSSFFAKKFAEFGMTWFRDFNGRKFPTARQVFAGLEACYALELFRRASGATNGALPDTIATYRRVFNTILALIALPDIDKPFNIWENDRIYGLDVPESKACFSMLWMYSLEPPLYYMLNRACRNRDNALLPLLGPFAKAIAQVLNGAEFYRNDKIK